MLYTITRIHTASGEIVVDGDDNAPGSWTSMMRALREVEASLRPPAYTAGEPIVVRAADNSGPSVLESDVNMASGSVADEGVQHRSVLSKLTLSAVGLLSCNHHLRFA